MWKRVAIGLGLAGFLALFVKELPAMKRELKIIKM
jgi:hypothetical protein